MLQVLLWSPQLTLLALFRTSVVGKEEIDHIFQELKLINVELNIFQAICRNTEFKDPVATSGCNPQQILNLQNCCSLQLNL